MPGALPPAAQQFQRPADGGEWHAGCEHGRSRYLDVEELLAAGIDVYTTLNVHTVTRWLVSALVPAFVIPNVLKWHWWRFNGHGFWAGMAGGTAAAGGAVAVKANETDTIKIVTGQVAGGFS